VSPTDLFTPRQLAVFGHAFRWIRTSAYPQTVRRALSLALSNALTTNNRFCGYATDYGRLAPLFSVRSYAIPALAVELNPFHPTAGRGTLHRGFERILRSPALPVRRFVWSPTRRRPVPKSMTFPVNGANHQVMCASAESPLRWLVGPLDLCLFDPPYFDYIAYSELSEFYRAWTGKVKLGGSPLLPEPPEPVRSFARRLAKCLRSVTRRLRKGRALVFTYHSASEDPWTAIGHALDQARLSVTAIWPLRNDAHMGHHSAAGNCEWDLVIVCRRRGECRLGRPSVSVQSWMRSVRPLKISSSDCASMSHGLSMVRRRFGRPRTDPIPARGEKHER
jgi:adenine-specific DNA methylase